MTEIENLSPLERRILNIIQSGFPTHPRPYRVVAEQAGCSEAGALECIRGLAERKIIRRLGGVFDSQKMGFVSTLAALQVSSGELEAAARWISALPGVTHNYQREHDFNLWFTLTCPSPEELDETLARVAALPGVQRLLNLPALRLFKIGVNLQL